MTRNSTLKTLATGMFLLLCLGACSKSRISNVLDDISRDTYENSVRRQRIENLGDPTYEEPPTYDQYQRERKELHGDNE